MITAGDRAVSLFESSEFHLRFNPDDARDNYRTQNDWVFVVELTGLRVQGSNEGEGPGGRGFNR